MKSSLEKSLNDIDSWIRQGDFEQARSAVTELAAISKERPFDRIASLARRAGLPHLALKILNRIVRPGPRSHVRATPEERIEYAAALFKVGAVQEASALLNTIDTELFPEALLYQAWTCFSQWDYPRSLPILRAYVAHPKVTDYKRNVGRVNLVAALLFNRELVEAESVLEQLTRDCQGPDTRFIKATILELTAQVAIAQNDTVRAHQALDEAALLLGSNVSLESLFIDKWRAVSLLATHVQNGVDALTQVRARALKMRHWETVRDCDYHRAIATGDVALLNYLYYGTPYNKYRERLLRSWEGLNHRDSKIAAFPSPEYVWSLGETTDGTEVFIRADSGENNLGPEFLKPGQLPQRLFSFLTRDFYRAHNLVALHAGLFPERIYNPLSSPNVVQQLLTRLRSWFEENKVPLAIRHLDGQYRLETSSACKIVITDRSESLSPKVRGSLEPRLKRYLQRLEERFGPKPFNSEEAANVLKISSRSSRRYLSEAREKGWIDATDSARPRYGFSKKAA